MKRLLPLFALLLATLAHADTMRIYDLNNRTAEELIPLVEPLLAPDGVVTGTGYQLIVRGTSQQQSQVERVLRQLDTAPQQLVISVRQGGGSDESEGGYSARGSIGNGTIRMGVDGPVTPYGGSVSTYGANGSGSVRVYRSDRLRNDNVAQRLMVLEGQWATISAGQQVAMPRQSVVQTPYGSQVQQGIEYQDVSSGFDVRPRLNGEQVTLEIAPYRRKLSESGGGAIDSQSINTTVRGRLGEWIAIGGVDESSSNDDSGISYSTHKRSDQTSDVWLKVEVVH